MLFHWSDYDIGVLRELLDALERHYFRLSGKAKDCADPESLGLFDSMEAVVGLSFVAAQACMERIYSGARMGVGEALARGPTLTCGVTIAGLVHEAANLWKHQGARERSTGERRNARSADILELLDVDLEYPFGNILHAIKDQGVPDLVVLADRVAEWRDSIEGPGYDLPVEESGD